MEEDILQPIPASNYSNYLTLFENNPVAAIAYNYVQCAIQCHENNKTLDEKHLKLFNTPYSESEDGAFVGIQGNFGVFLFTLAENCDSLCEALVKTKRIDWSRVVLMYDSNHSKILDVIKTKKPKCSSVIKAHVFWVPKEEAVKFKINCDNNVYISKLEDKHVELIDSKWPARNLHSKSYISMLVSNKGGYGVFLKSSDELVSWCLRDVSGMAILFTVEKYRGKGYATLVLKTVAKGCAQDGFEPLGKVFENNAEFLSILEGSSNVRKIGSVSFIK